MATDFRQRLPGVGVKKLHKLLYYCQGHHLAAFDEPLFADTISAWDMGPVVGRLWKRESDGAALPPPRDLSQSALNTVGYVVSRYGGLTGGDLERLTHTEEPWQRADKLRKPGGRARIENAWIRDHFRADALGDEEVMPPLSSVREWLANAPRRRAEPLRADTAEEVAARLSARA